MILVSSSLTTYMSMWQRLARSTFRLVKSSHSTLTLQMGGTKHKIHCNIATYYPLSHEEYFIYGFAHIWFCLWKYYSEYLDDVSYWLSVGLHARSLASCMQQQICAFYYKFTSKGNVIPGDILLHNVSELQTLVAALESGG